VFDLGVVGAGRPAPFGLPKGVQDEVKFGPKTNQNRCQKRNRKKKVSKIVLELSWADLGSSWVPSWGHVFDLGYGKKKRFLKNRVFEQIRCQEATWTALGPIWAAKRLQNGGRGGSKSELS
jgi:hypothetical protein